MQLWPTWKQFRQWSLPSKYTFISFLLGALMSGISVYFTVRPNPRLVQLEKALRAEKSTNLGIASVDAGYHVGVRDELVFVTLRNQSNRPAYSVAAQVLVDSSAGLSRPSEESVQTYYRDDLMIPATGSLRMPVAYVKDARSALGVDCIRGFTKEPEKSSGNFTEAPLGIYLEYETVFGEETETLASMWAVVPAQCS